jgi:pimeloyl-ACP methyl ester carboxylesterase
MADDLNETLQEKIKDKIILLGHSMGGKTAMRLTMKYPEIVSQLIVADIAPKDYGLFANYAETTANHENILKAMQNLHPEEMESRSEMDAALKGDFPAKTLRQFLLKNVKRKKGGRYQWQLNIDALRNNLPELMDGFSHLNESQAVKGIPTVFIRGEKSPYIKDEDTLSINRYFPGSQLVTIPDAGHWLHAEQPELFLKTLLYYIQ